MARQAMVLRGPAPTVMALSGLTREPAAGSWAKATRGLASMARAVLASMARLALHQDTALKGSTPRPLESRMGCTALHPVAMVVQPVSSVRVHRSVSRGPATSAYRGRAPERGAAEFMPRLALRRGTVFRESIPRRRETPWACMAPHRARPVTLGTFMGIYRSRAPRTARAARCSRAIL